PVPPPPPPPPPAPPPAPASGTPEGSICTSSFGPLPASLEKKWAPFRSEETIAKLCTTPDLAIVVTSQSTSVSGSTAVSAPAQAPSAGRVAQVIAVSLQLLSATAQIVPEPPAAEGEVVACTRRIA